MLNTDRVVTIVGYDVSQETKDILFRTSFHCNRCKHVQNCINPQDCNFAQYICQRIPSTVYKYDLETPVLNINIVNANDETHALRTIARAKKLRTIKPELRCR